MYKKNYPALETGNYVEPSEREGAF